MSRPDHFVQRNINPRKRWTHNERCLWECSTAFHQPNHGWPWPWFTFTARFVR